MSRTKEDPEALLPVVKDLKTAIFVVAESSEGKSGMKSPEKVSGTRPSKKEPGTRPSERKSGVWSSEKEPDMKPSEEGAGAKMSETKPETKPSGTTLGRITPPLAEREARTITYDIRWNTGQSGRRRSGKRSAVSSSGPYAELIVSCPAPVTPQMKLVYREDGHVPLSEANPGLVVLHTIEPFPKGFPDGKYICAFDADAFRTLRPGTQLRLMLSTKDIGSYYMRIQSVENLKVPEPECG